VGPKPRCGGRTEWTSVRHSCSACARLYCTSSPEEDSRFESQLASHRDRESQWDLRSLNSAAVGRHTRSASQHEPHFPIRKQQNGKVKAEHLLTRVLAEVRRTHTWHTLPMRSHTAAVDGTDGARHSLMEPVPKNW
jgi:hypothetical protein